MYSKLIINGETTQLYYHKTGGGAEYLTDAYIIAPDGTREGIFAGATVIIRIDGDEIEIITNQ